MCAVSRYPDEIDSLSSCSCISQLLGLFVNSTDTCMQIPGDIVAAVERVQALLVRDGAPIDRLMDESRWRQGGRDLSDCGNAHPLKWCFLLFLKSERAAETR